MKKYDYEEAVKSDIQDYIKNEVDLNQYDSLEEAYEKIEEDLWTEDSVTGNGSGSYTFNTYEAEENLRHNWDLLNDVLSEFGCDPDKYRSEKGAEACDVSIRCYLMPRILREVLEEDYYEVWEPKKFEVTLYYHSSVTVEVEAKNREEALENARCMDLDSELLANLQDDDDPDVHLVEEAS